MTTAAAPVTDLRTSHWSAMGSQVRLVMRLDPAGPGAWDALEASARTLVEDCEAAWSRFRATSDVSRLNAAGGAAVPVHERTALLLELARLMWRQTDGRFDPSVHDAMVADGYDAPLDEVRARPGAAVPPTPDPWTPREPRGRSLPPAPGLAGLHLARLADGAWEARLPRGVRFDPGGIGKGLAADLVVADLVAQGAAGASLSVGGDVVSAGAPPEPSGWWTEVVDPAGPHAGQPVALVGVLDGAVVTSTPCLRRWRSPAGAVTTHLRDPRNGRSLTHPDLRFVTVVGGTGWWAEAQATAACVEAVRHPGGPVAWARDVVAADRTRAMVVGVGHDAVVPSPAADEHLWHPGRETIGAWS